MTLSTSVSDALCRLATGGGFATRTLYENDEETIFDAMRPAILTGIEELANRSDLRDRCLILQLPRIPEDRRRPESDFWREFDAAHGRILGAVLDAVSAAIRDLPADDGGLSVDAPAGELTEERLDLLKAHKAELLAMLRPATGATIDVDPDDDDAQWLDCIEADGGRSWTRVDVADQQVVDLMVCPKCGSNAHWQSMASDLFGRTPGRWRCVKCEPPTTARRIRSLAAKYSTNRQGR